VARGDKGPAFFVYSDNYLIDVKFGVIVDQILRAWLKFSRNYPYCRALRLLVERGAGSERQAGGILTAAGVAEVFWERPRDSGVRIEPIARADLDAASETEARFADDSFSSSTGRVVHGWSA